MALLLFYLVIVIASYAITNIVLNNGGLTRAYYARRGYTYDIVKAPKVKYGPVLNVWIYKDNKSVSEVDVYIASNAKLVALRALKDARAAAKYDAQT